MTLQTAGKTMNDLEQAKQEVARMSVEIEGLRKDAERYRWLQTKAYVGIAPHPKPHEVWCLRLPNPKGFNNLAAAVDAAIQRELT